MYKALRVCLLSCTVIFLPSLIFAAPIENEPFEFSQPDGSLVPVIVSGDEFYQDVETPEGYPLVRDPKTGWICYAIPSPDGSEWVSTGTVYEPRKSVAKRLSLLGVRKSARLNSASVLAKRKTKFLELNGVTYEESMSEFHSSADALSKTITSVVTPPLEKPDTVVGLTILIDFPDIKSAIPRDSIVNWLNMRGYTGYSNNGSIFDYFYDVSDGKMVYSNKCTDFITANYPKSHYDTGTGYAGSTELITEICNKLKNAGNFDFSALTVVSGLIRATNILYAGTPSAGWANGLWPHSGTLRFTFITGVQMSAHQLTNIGTSLRLGTFCHENGHMLCKWKDLYAYDSHSNGAGRFCVMSSTNTATNPQQPNGFFRSLMKWVTVIDITGDPLGSVYSHAANGPSVYLWNGASAGSSQEGYYIEARRRVGRSAGLPDSGLLIWHVDKAGDNTTEGRNDYCVPEQADGLFQIENKVNSGADGDCFHAGYRTEFNDNTSPSAVWHNGVNSGIPIANISAVGPTMSFSLGNIVHTGQGAVLAKHQSDYFIGRTASGVRFFLPDLDVAQINVRIDLFNLNGTLAGTLLNNPKATGQGYFLTFNDEHTGTPKFSAGTYLCTLSANGIKKSITVIVK